MRGEGARDNAIVCSSFTDTSDVYQRVHDGLKSSVFGRWKSCQNMLRLDAGIALWALGWWHDIRVRMQRRIVVLLNS